MPTSSREDFVNGLLSIVGIFVAYELGRALVGAGAGLLAALVLAVFPLDVLAATTLYPDTPWASRSPRRWPWSFGPAIRGGRTCGPWPRGWCGATPT